MGIDDHTDCCQNLSGRPRLIPYIYSRASAMPPSANIIRFIKKQS